MWAGGKPRKECSHRASPETKFAERSEAKGDRPQAGGEARQGATPAQWEHPINPSLGEATDLRRDESPGEATDHRQAVKPARA